MTDDSRVRWSAGADGLMEGCEGMSCVFFHVFIIVTLHTVEQRPFLAVNTLITTLQL